jgi:hypothetical protein
LETIIIYILWLNIIYYDNFHCKMSGPFNSEIPLWYILFIKLFTKPWWWYMRPKYVTVEWGYEIYYIIGILIDCNRFYYNLIYFVFVSMDPVTLFYKARWYEKIKIFTSI